MLSVAIKQSKSTESDISTASKHGWKSRSSGGLRRPEEADDAITLATVSPFCSFAV